MYASILTIHPVCSAHNSSFVSLGLAVSINCVSFGGDNKCKQTTGTRAGCTSPDPSLNSCPQLASYMILISVTQTAFQGFEKGLCTIVMYETTQSARLPCSGVKSGLGVFEGSWALPLAGAIPYLRQEQKTQHPHH